MVSGEQMCICDFHFHYGYIAYGVIGHNIHRYHQPSVAQFLSHLLSSAHVSLYVRYTAYINCTPSSFSQLSYSPHFCLLYSTNKIPSYNHLTPTGTTMSWVPDSTMPLGSYTINLRCDAEDSDASAPRPERTPPPSSDTDGFESDEEIMPLPSYGTHILPIHVTMTYLTADPGLPGLRRKLLATRRANRQRQTSESQRGGDRIRSRQSAVKLTPSQMQADEKIQQEVAGSKPVAMPPTPVMTDSLPPSSQRASVPPKRLQSYANRL